MLAVNSFLQTQPKLRAGGRNNYCVCLIPSAASICSECHDYQGKITMQSNAVSLDLTVFRLLSLQSAGDHFFLSLYLFVISVNKV